MAEIVVSAFVNMMIEKLVSGTMKLAGYEGIDTQLNKWTNILRLIQDEIADADHKQIAKKAVQTWLNELRDLAYDIDDVLDDMMTEAAKRELNQEADVSTSGSRKLIKTVKDTFTRLPYKIFNDQHMRSKLDEITIRVNDLLDRKKSLGLDEHVNIKVERSNAVVGKTSFVDESKVLGREGDKEKLLEKLLGNESSNQNVSVVSIVGLGGIGKTTLAKILYSDPKVKDQFDLRAWISVSEEFDVMKISKAVFQALGGSNQDFASVDLLHMALKEKLSNKRFLIVLDDVWNEDHDQWELLKSPFVFGSPGSKIIVTTRKKKVALVMGSVQPYDLGLLSDEIALSLFAYNALNEENFDKFPSLKVIAQGIIKKCDGLPLALVVLGRVLKIKGTSDDKWEELLKSDVWDIEDGSGILPALKLSYYDLPPHLKQLFAYCSLFPKDYLFKKDRLVLLWMAEGFISQSNGSNTMESLGRQYFEDLQSRSFFQHSTNKKSKYIMHDLMNDLAIRVAGDFFFMLDDKMDVNGRNEAFEKFRHFSFFGQRHAQFRKFKELHRSRRLRTFLPIQSGGIPRWNFCGWASFDTFDHVLMELFPRLQYLRVLSLTHNSITNVPQSICDFKHLRYLNFSKTHIKQVPQPVSELYNLQSLLVRHCHELANLPASFAKLKNLRHLDMTDTPFLRKTPLGISGLTSLQTLSKVNIDEANGFNVSDLKDLINLEGQLSIKGLEKVIDGQQALDANLEEKKGLVSLDMEWSNVFNESRKSKIEYEVIQRLRPPTKLNNLKIFHYGGMRFPSWFVDPSFDKLTELTIEGCKNCTHLTGSFSHLREIRIKNCPILVRVSIGSIPSLEVLVIEKCSKAVFTDIVCASSAIQSLRISFIEDLSKLDGEVLKHLVKLQTLSVHACYKLVSIGEIEVTVESSNMKSSVLREVYLSGCRSLKSYNCPKSVEKLEIKRCNLMTSFTLSTTLHELPSSLKVIKIWSCHNLKSFSDELPSSLEDLEIWYCKNLKSFPHEYLQSLTSLKRMKISNCPSMDVTFPCGSWPPNLRELEIGKLKKPMSEWGLQNYPTSLAVLTLDGSKSGVTSFAMEGDETNTSSTSFFLPPSLTCLWISHFKDVESISEVVLQHLTYLELLTIKHCPNIRDVPQTTSSLEVSVWQRSFWSFCCSLNN